MSASPLVLILVYKQMNFNPIMHGGSEVALKHGVGVNLPPPPSP